MEIITKSTWKCWCGRMSFSHVNSVFTFSRFSVDVVWNTCKYWKIEIKDWKNNNAQPDQLLVTILWNKLEQLEQKKLQEAEKIP